MEEFEKQQDADLAKMRLIILTDYLQSSRQYAIYEFRCFAMRCPENFNTLVNEMNEDYKQQMQIIMRN
jgi:hypothetical protein